MALDLSRITASVDRSNKSIEAVLAAHATATDPALQTALNALADKLDADSAKAEAAVTAPPGT